MINKYADWCLWSTIELKWRSDHGIHWKANVEFRTVDEIRVMLGKPKGDKWLVSILHKYDVLEYKGVLYFEWRDARSLLVEHLQKKLKKV